jgi:alkylhydroperoxidase/carboxymuconolactone decarboxylase family protein YurZ
MAARKRIGSDNGTDQKADALIARMKKARGYIYPEWEFAARQDPEFVETYNRIYELGLGEGKHVSAKVREFVAIALLAFRGGEKAGLVAHMERAIRFGATREELFEVLETCLIPGGAPTFHRGLSALLEVKGGRGSERGDGVACGPQPGALRPRHDHRAVPRLHRHFRESGARGRLVARPAAARFQRPAARAVRACAAQPWPRRPRSGGWPPGPAARRASC